MVMMNDSKVLEYDLDKQGPNYKDYVRPKLFDEAKLRKQCSRRHYVFNMMCIGKSLKYQNDRKM